MLIELLVTTIGAAITEAVITVWLQENPLTTLGVEIIASRVEGYLEKKRARRRFEEISEKVGESLLPIFEEYETISTDTIPPNFDSVAYEVARAIEISKFDSARLAKLNYKPERLVKYIHNHYPSPSAVFNDVEQQLYQRSIDVSAQYIIDMSQAMPGFSKDAFSEILTRLDEAVETLDRFFLEIESMRAISRANNTETFVADFEEKYRQTIIRELDKVYIFGVDVGLHLKRYSLSIAYVSLEVQAGEADARGDIDERLTVEDALANHSRFAIIGAAGSGKTTLLRWLAIQSAGNRFSENMRAWRNRIPFFLPLRSYRNELPNVEQFIDYAASQLQEIKPPEWVHSVLSSGRGMLLIDGLDEVSPDKRENVYFWLSDLQQDYPNAIFVFTSRRSAYADDWLSEFNFTELTLAPMRYDDIKSFIRYWHNAVVETSSSNTFDTAKVYETKLLDKVSTNSSLRQLASSPLLCAMLCLLHYDRGTYLPRDRNSLYEACIESLLDRRDKERKVHLGHYPALSYKQQRVLLDYLASWAMGNGYTSFDYSEAKTIINNRRVYVSTGTDYTAKQVLDYFLERSGILRQPSIGIVDFVHRTFQEYMAACNFVKERDFGLLADKAKDYQWHETIILASGQADAKDASKLIKKILQLADKETYIERKVRLQFLAIACLESATEVLPDVRSEVESVLKTLIPPKTASDVSYLASSGDTVVQFLSYNDQLGTSEKKLCIRVLGQVSTHKALQTLKPYIEARIEGTQGEISTTVSRATPEEIATSGVASSIVQNFDFFISDRNLTINGTVLNAISRLSDADLRQINKHTQFVDHVTISNFAPKNAYILQYFPNLRSLTLVGNVDFQLMTRSNPQLKRVKFVNQIGNWPQLLTVQEYEELEFWLDEEQQEINWDDAFSALGEAKELKKLTIFVTAAEYFPDFNVLMKLNSLMGKLKRIRITFSENSWQIFKNHASLYWFLHKTSAYCHDRRFA